MTEQERNAMVRDFIVAIVGVYVRWMRPTIFDETFRVGLVRVHVRIEEAEKTNQDTQPLQRKDM